MLKMVTKIAVAVCVAFLVFAIADMESMKSFHDLVLYVGGSIAAGVLNIMDEAFKRRLRA